MDFGIIRSIYLIGLILSAALLCAEGTQGTPNPEVSEPGVYRIRCRNIRELENDIWVRFQQESGFSVATRAEKEPGVYRLAVLGSDKIHREVAEILRKHAEILPKISDASVTRISAPKSSPSSLQHRQYAQNPALPQYGGPNQGVPHFVTVHPGVPGVVHPGAPGHVQPGVVSHGALSQGSIPATYRPGPEPAPNIQTQFVSPHVPRNPTSAAAPSSETGSVIPGPIGQAHESGTPSAVPPRKPVFVGTDRPFEETRDSFSPTHASVSKIEQTLRSLLGARMNEMSPGKYLVSVSKDKNAEHSRKHCTLEVDRESSRVLLVGEKSLCDQLVALIDAVDQPNPPEGRERRFVPLSHVKGETVAKILEINRSPKRLAATSYPAVMPQGPESRHLQPQIQPQTLPNGDPTSNPSGRNPGDEQPRIEFRRDGMGQDSFSPESASREDGRRHLHPQRNPVIQLVGYQFQADGFASGGLGADLGGDLVGPGVDGMNRPGGPGGPAGPGMEVVSDFRFQILDDLDVLIIDATGAEVARFTDMIRQIEELSKIAEPTIDVYYLKHVNCVSLNWVIFQVYVDLFRTKQGTVKVIPLINPNAMLLIGWGNAMDAMKDLIETLDKPVADEHNMLQVFKLKHASASTILPILRGTFPIPPAQNSAFTPRIQMYADMRTNSLIVQAGRNDMKDIERLIVEMDVPGGGPKLQIKTFKLKHTLAGDLAQVLTGALTPGISGTQDRKLPILEMLVVDEKGQRMIESGIMSDVRVSQDARTNTIIVTGPEQCMPLMEEFIKRLDMPSATAEIKVFQILYGDADSMVQTLRSLIPAQVEGQAGPQLPGPAVSKDEDSMIPVRFAVDKRTNCILAAGAPNDLKIIEALLYSIDREDQQTRKQTVYMLKSMMAKDVALAVNEYIRSKRLIQQSAPGVISPYQQIESEVIVIAESVSNSLIVSATPRYYEEILELIQEIDRHPPQVMIQVLIGEVTLSNADEFGAEFGFQDSLLFNRSTFDNIQTGTQTITETLADGTKRITETPIIVSGTATPGWLFNESPTSSLSDGYNSTSSQSAGNVGSQLLTNFATGRVGAETGFGGMVFSANSDAVSIMIRALQETNRLEVLSRPQITAMNNQPAAIHVGQLVPRFSGTSSSYTNSDSKVEDVEVGLQLMVTPSISPEGNVVMLVSAEKSKIGTENVVVGFSNNNPVRSPVIDRIHTMTQISAADNETVVLGGLIAKEDQKLHRKVPLLGDIPVLGKLFSYEYNKCKRSELIIILTPHIIRDQKDMEKIKQVETARMNWCLGNVARLHGDIGTYDVVAEQPYAGDAKVVFPEAIDMDSLTPLDEPEKKDRAPKLAPPQSTPQPGPDTQKLPAPILPKKP